MRLAETFGRVAGLDSMVHQDLARQIVEVGKNTLLVINGVWSNDSSRNNPKQRDRIVCADANNSRLELFSTPSPLKSTCLIN